MPRKTARYGWKPQLPDHRDIGKVYAVPIKLDAKVDLRPEFPPVYNQGDTSSCTCNAFPACVDYERKRQGLEFMNPSRLWLYYMVRKLEGTVGQDCGAELRDVLKVLVAQGVPRESDWVFDPSKLNNAPPDSLSTEAEQYKTLKYRSPYTNQVNLKAGLQLGYPFAFGFTVYDSFESDAVAKSGIVPMPNETKEGCLGGHAVVAVGYDDSISDPTWAKPGAFLVRNSWGPEWGQAGYFWMSYAYVTNPDLASDFWSVRLESTGA